MIKNIKTVKIALLLLNSVILICAGFVLVMYQYNSILQEQKESLLKEDKHIEFVYTSALQYLKEETQVFSEFVMHSSGVKSALYNKDRKKLQELNAPLFKLLHTYNPYLKIMTFRLDNGESFLRLHKLDMFGDTVHQSRKSILRVNKIHTSQSGFKVGKLTMAYRVITPIFFKNKYIGSLEVGIDPEYVLNRLKDGHPLKYAVLIKPSATVAALDLSVLANIDDYYMLDGDSFFIVNKDKIKLKNKSIHSNITYENNLYSLSSNLNIFGIDGSSIGKILIANERNEASIKTTKLIQKAFIFTLVIIFILGALLHLGVNYFIRKIEHTQKQLELFNLTLEKEVLAKTKEQGLLLSLFDQGESVLFKWNNDPYWTIDSVSDSVQRLTGYSKEEFISKSIDYASCIHPNDIVRVTSEVTQALQSNSDFFTHEPYRIFTKDNEIKWIHDSTTLVKDENSKVTHFIGVISDISELKQKEQQLLNQSRLAQMGEMISMIAHQWRQPLSAISATTISLKVKIDLEKYDLSIEEERRKCQENFIMELDKIEEFTEVLSCTINDFRSFYKPNKNHTPILISESIQKALKIMQSSLINNQITLIQDYQESYCLELIENEIMQVILNILKNSQDNFQINESHNRKIWMKTHDIKNGVLLSIRDNAGGIEEKNLPKIFDPYFSTKHDKNGTGLGLYMSKLIIEEHHKGNLEVINTEDGVCFNVFLYMNENL